MKMVIRPYGRRSDTGDKKSGREGGSLRRSFINGQIKLQRVRNPSARPSHLVGRDDG